MSVDKELPDLTKPVGLDLEAFQTRGVSGVTDLTGVIGRNVCWVGGDAMFGRSVEGMSVSQLCHLFPL